MVIGYFDGFRAGIRPFKTDPKLVINPQAVLSGAFAAQSLKLVPRRMA